MLDPQQELFVKIKSEIEKLGYSVYDGELPPEGTPYPFVYLGDFDQHDIVLKNALIGNVHPTIHIWHNSPRQRGTVSKMLLEIKAIIYKLEATDSFKWSLRGIGQRIITDNTTKMPLMHGILEADYQFS